MATNFGDGDEKYSALYGNEMIRAIPPGSVYFCGMNPGGVANQSNVLANQFDQVTSNLKGLLKTGQEFPAARKRRGDSSSPRFITHLDVVGTGRSHPTQLSLD